MRTFALLYNLSCGPRVRAERRLGRLRHAFRARDVELRPYCTSTPLSSSAVVQAAAAGGCDAILAAGGDGTFNDLLQATMLNAGPLPIGIVPYGSGNVLAQELGIRGDAGQIASEVAASAAVEVPVGLLQSGIGNGTHVRRYFAVAAGIGADARVICRVNPAWKRQFGIQAYYAEAARQLLLTRDPLPAFRVRFLDLDTRQEREETVSQVIVERVGYFSQPLLRSNGAIPMLDRFFRLVLFKTQQRATYIHYGLHLLARRWKVRAGAISNVEVAHATLVCCDPLPEPPGPDVLTEVDGEMVGGLPAKITMIPQAIQFIPRRLLHQAGQ